MNQLKGIQKQKRNRPTKEIRIDIIIERLRDKIMQNKLKQLVEK